MGIFSLKLSNQIAHLRANMIMRIFFSEAAQSDDEKPKNIFQDFFENYKMRNNNNLYSILFLLR